MDAEDEDHDDDDEHELKWTSVWVSCVKHFTLCVAHIKKRKTIIENN